jgi:hypothetical protein
MIFRDLSEKGIVHSCYPNSGYDKNNDLVEFRQRVEDEQITVDFSTLFLGMEDQFWCNCGYFGCRKRIVGFDMIPMIFHEKYILNDLVPAQILESCCRLHWMP